MLLLIFLTSVSLNIVYTHQAERDHYKSVIVIGAGPSGIATATKLIENGVNVFLLEAENRIGGRIYSIRFGDAFVEMGAEWVHGEENNIVYELVKDMGFLKHNNSHFQLYRSDGTSVDTKLSDMIYKIYYDVYNDEDIKAAWEGRTVGEYFLERYIEEVDNAFANDSRKHNLSLEAINFFHHYILSDEGAFNWHDVSANSDYQLLPGDYSLNWNGRGYKTILDVLMKKLPIPDPNFPIDETIRLNSKVHKIKWNKKKWVSLEVGGGRKYTAKYVVFTGSLGVLKANHKELFSPRLPYEKKEVIQKLGIAAVMKVMLHFPTNFWVTNDNFTEFSFLWTEEDRKMLKTVYPYGPMLECSHWLEDFYFIQGVEQNDKVLSAWFTGPSIPEVEQMSDDTLIDGIIFTLKHFLGATKKVVRPDRIFRSNWFNNPNFRGSYSFQTIEARQLEGSPNLILAQPLINKYTGKPEVIFAGEATNPIHYGTVHGAIESGYRAAKEVLKAMNKL